ncbi:hypothetical protein Tco_0199695 [Tanacetum coccineum]
MLGPGRHSRGLFTVAATVNAPAVPEHDEAETVHNMSEENKLYFKAEKEAIFLLLTGIGDEIYSTVDACNTANEMWTAIERHNRMVKICDGCQAIKRDSPSYIFTTLFEFESISEEDSDPEQAQRDKDMQKNLALLAKYFNKLYKPTNNNL